MVCQKPASWVWVRESSQGESEAEVLPIKIMSPYKCPDGREMLFAPSTSAKPTTSPLHNGKARFCAVFRLERY